MRASAPISTILLSLVAASPAFAQAGVTKSGQGRTWNCYNFGVINHTAGKRITDLHFSVPGTPKRAVPADHMRTPINWMGGVDANGDLVFRTPPAQLPAPHTVAKPVENPIAPGDSLHGFRFCLSRHMPLQYSISYSDGSMAPQGQFGGVGAGGTVVHNSTLRCVHVRVTAGETPVFDVHLAGTGATKAGIDQVGLPPGWSGGASDDGSQVNVQTGPQPLAAGRSADLELCFEHVPSSMTWKYTDKDHKDIPGAVGQVKLGA